jgi:hypothetical protein
MNTKSKNTTTAPAASPATPESVPAAWQPHVVTAVDGRRIPQSVTLSGLPDGLVLTISLMLPIDATAPVEAERVRRRQELTEEIRQRALKSQEYTTWVEMAAKIRDVERESLRLARELEDVPERRAALLASHGIGTDLAAQLADLSTQEADLRSQLGALDTGLPEMREELVRRAAAIEQPVAAAAMAARLHTLAVCEEAKRTLQGIGATVASELNELAASLMLEGDVGALTLDPRRHAQQIVAKLTTGVIPAQPPAPAPAPLAVE